jgi:hypothetical protein
MRKFRISLIFVAFLCFWWACSKDGAVSPSTSSDTGKGGSLARFAIVGNFLYVVSDWDLKTYNISTPNSPVFVGQEDVGWGIETIFAYDKKLFLGGNNGVFMYEILNTGLVVRKGSYRHFTACDPVVVEGIYAYSTVRSGVECRTGGTINELQILDVSDINAPKLVTKVPMTFPIGVGIDGNYLFVCDKDGLRILDVSVKNSPKEMHYLKNVDAQDVIVLDKKLLIIGKEKLTQLDYQNINNPTIISTLNLK